MMTIISKLASHIILNVSTILILLLLSGCSSLIHKTAGNTMHSVGHDLMMPYLFASSDPKMACTSAEANAPLLLAFDQVDIEMNDLAIGVMLTASLCEQDRAFEEELRHYRALHQKDSIAAQDARSLQKSLLAAAARRQLKGYEAYESFFSVSALADTCPSFDNDREELAWLLGNLVGVQAIFNDTAADMSVMVPRNVAAKAERAVQCLDNKKWWGLPLALRAAIWSAIPGTAPPGASPWDAMLEASEIGVVQGVRMADALWVMAANGAGDTAQVKRVITRHAKNLQSFPSNKEYLLFDKMGSRLIEQMSDRLWTEQTGHRTPFNRLGYFWDDESQSFAGKTIDIDDLL